MTRSDKDKELLEEIFLGFTDCTREQTLCAYYADPDVFAERVKQMRKKNDFSQQQLASRIGISKQRVHLIEAGKMKKVDYVIADHISRALACTTDYLMGYTAQSSLNMSNAELYLVQQGHKDLLPLNDPPKSLNSSLTKRLKTPYVISFDYPKQIKDHIKAEDVELLELFNSCTQLSPKKRTKMKSVIRAALELCKGEGESLSP